MRYREFKKIQESKNFSDISKKWSNLKKESTDGAILIQNLIKDLYEFKSQVGDNQKDVAEVIEGIIHVLINGQKKSSQMMDLIRSLMNLIDQINNVNISRDERIDIESKKTFKIFNDLYVRLSYLYDKVNELLDTFPGDKE